MRLWVVGGRQQRPAGALDRDHGALYDEALVVEVDGESGAITPRLRWRDPQWPQAGHCFKGASMDGALLLLVTERALVWVDPVGWEVVRTWTHPWLNDVHHAIRHDGAIWIANTGLDALVELRGDEVHFHPLGSARAPSGDARLRDLRPHEVHPNHLLVRDGALFATRFHAGDAVSLAGEVLAVGAGRLHDGNPEGLEVWFTSVDGQLVSTGSAIRLEPPDATGEPLGWCRGLLLEPETAWVGFSRIRATRSREHLAWAAGTLRGEVVATRRPTRIGRFDRRTGALRTTVELASSGVDAVFAILEAPASG